MFSLGDRVLVAMLEIAFYAVVVALLATYVYFDMRKRRLIRFLEAYRTPEAKKLWGTEQGWRRPTGIKFLEDLKTDLLQAEKHIAAAKKEAEEFAFIEVKRGSNGKPTLENYSWHGWNIRSFSVEELAVGRQLIEKLDRLWAGDTYGENAERRTAILQWQRSRADLQSDDKSGLRKCDDRILQLEREIEDLAEIKRRAEQRSAEHPKRTEHRTDREIHTLGVEDRVMRGFEGSKTVLEIRNVRRLLIEQTNSNESLSPEDKKAVLAQIDLDAKAAEARLNSSAVGQQKPGSIYSEDR